MDKIIATNTTSTTCCYCGVGCGVKASTVDGRLISVAGDAEHPANAGKLCIKGSNLHETQYPTDRLLAPKVNGEATSWSDALDYTAMRFRQIIQQHGPDSVAFYLSGQLLTEDYYVANKLMKGFIGTANVDTNSRLCMASAVIAHKRAFGEDIVAGCYDDLELADVVFLVGSNLAYAHPIVYQRLQQAKKRRPDMKVVVLDPRRTATCELADVHLPLAAGSDGFFFNGLLTYLAWHNGLDQTFIDAHCDGFNDALQTAQQQTPNISVAAKQCGLSVEQIKQVYEWFSLTDRVVTVFSQGINQSSSGADKGSAIINCHLASGKIGKPGATPFSITGQPNAMGGREVGGLANQLAAHMSFGNSADIERVAQFWDAPNMAQNEGLKAVDMFKAIGEGKIKAVWIMATNPAVSMPGANTVVEALKKCDFVVLSECVENTDTAKLADVLLPATTWGEKTGTVTNSERCISLQKGFLSPPGEARHDWEIICDFAKRLGFQKQFNYDHPVEIFREHAALSALDNHGKRGFDISAFKDISVEQYQAFKPIQWPVNADYPHGRQRLFDDGVFFTEDRRAKFVSVTAQLPKAKRGAQQVTMNTGRIRDQWHSMSRTGVAAKLWTHTDEPFVEVHPDDIDRFGLQEGGLAVLSHRGAEYVARVRSAPGQSIGDVFVPIHWNDKFASSARADALVDRFVDPVSGQPEFKHCVVQLKPFPGAWQGVLLSTLGAPTALTYWAKVATTYGVKLHLAETDITKPWQEWLEQQFPQVADWVLMRDSAKEVCRVAGFMDTRLVVSLGVRWGYSPLHHTSWLDSVMGTKVDPGARFSVLAGAPPGRQEDIGKIICSCYEVGENTIAKAIRAGCCSVEVLGQKLRCGTGCGSCVPELQSILRSSEATNSTEGAA